MKYTFPEAPLYKVDGIPNDIAGEWTGHKSNKFERTRKCIKAVDKEDILHGSDFFNQNARKRHFSIGPSTEKGFKPCMRVYPEAYYTSKDISDQVVIWPQQKNEAILNLQPKKHYFEQRDTYIESLNNKAKRSENKVFIKEELNYLSKIGYMLSKRDFADMIEKHKTNEAMKNEINENQSKTKYVNSSDIQTILDNNKHIDPLFLIPQLSVKPEIKKKKPSNKHDYLTQKRENELIEMKIKMELIKKDIEYVKDLDAWDNSNLRVVK